MMTGKSLRCHWCQVPLGSAAAVVYLNGNLPVCDLCLMAARGNQRGQVRLQGVTAAGSELSC